MLCLSGFKLYSGWVPLLHGCSVKVFIIQEERQRKSLFAVDKVLQRITFYDYYYYHNNNNNNNNNNNVTTIIIIIIIIINR